MSTRLSTDTAVVLAEIRESLAALEARLDPAEAELSPADRAAIHLRLLDVSRGLEATARRLGGHR